MIIIGTFGDFTPDLSSPICGGFAVVPDDTAAFQSITRAIVLAIGGNVSVVLKNGDAITSVNRRGDLSSTYFACVGDWHNSNWPEGASLMLEAGVRIQLHYYFTLDIILAFPLGFGWDRHRFPLTFKR